MSVVPSVDEIAWLRDNSPAWRLLRADNAPLVLSFLHRVFVADNVRSISAAELASRLDDELYALNQQDSERAAGSPSRPRPTSTTGRRPEAGWLRKYYPDGTDEPHYDATPAVEKALQWLDSLREREFVGTESRLKVDLRVAAADRVRHRARSRGTAGRAAPPAGRHRRADSPDRGGRAAHARRDARFATATSSSPGTARELLADFREVEENFRKLDRQLREKIAGWHGGKGELLDDVLGSRESIAGSDQGRSFQAFYGFLLSQARQEELSSLLDRVHALAGIAEHDTRLRHVHYDWLDAAAAHPGDGPPALRAAPPVPRRPGVVREPPGDRHPAQHRGPRAGAARNPGTSWSPWSSTRAAPAIRLPLERPLYAPVRKARLTSDAVRDADEETDPAALFEQVYVDPEPLRGGVRQALRGQPQVGLAELVARYPLRQGVAELVTYLSLRDEAFAIVYDEQHRDADQLVRPRTAGNASRRCRGSPTPGGADDRRTGPVARRHPAHEGRRLPRHARPRVAQLCSSCSRRPGTTWTCWACRSSSMRPRATRSSASARAIPTTPIRCPG